MAGTAALVRCIELVPCTLTQSPLQAGHRSESANHKRATRFDDMTPMHAG